MKQLYRIFSVLIFSFIIFSIKIQAQKSYHHNLSWGRLVLTDTIHKRLRWELYLQHRRQNVEQSDFDIFEASQFTSYWGWLHYTVSPTTKFSFSPLGYFKSWILVAKPADIEKPEITEWRISARVDNEVKGKYFNLINRYGLEYRQRDLLNNGVFQPNWRVRYMLRFEKTLKPSWLPKPITLVVNDEIFIQFGKAVRGNPNIFDQNRVYVGFNYPITKNIKTSLGYIWGIQERPSGTETDYSNIIWGVLTFDNLFSQFKKKRV